MLSKVLRRFLTLPISGTFFMLILLLSTYITYRYQYSWQSHNHKQRNIDPQSIHQNVETKQLLNNILSNSTFIDLWFHLFLTDIITNTFSHHFEYKFSDYPHSDFHQITAAENMPYLLEVTNDQLQQSNSTSYHNKLLLKRSVTIFCITHSLTQMCKDTVLNIQQWIKHGQLQLNNRVYFNIHLSKSAGTTICETFKRNGIKTDPRNCNIKGNSAVFHTNELSFTQSCHTQYQITKSNHFGLAAREAPMHGNGEYSHPQLCAQFIYSLPVREPLERVLSALQMMHCLLHSKLNRETVFPKMSLLPRAQVPNEYMPCNLAKWKADFKGKDYFHRLLVTQELFPNWKDSKMKRIAMTFMSNALLRYIGYESTDNNEETALSAHFETVNNPSNDIHFYNAIKYMMKTDYVLPFAALNTSLTINASEIWNVLLLNIAQHFHLNNSAYFTFWGHSADKTKYRKEFISSLSSKDIDAINAYNYYDRKLYALAHLISKADLHSF